MIDTNKARELAQEFTMQLGCGVRDDDDRKCVIDYLCVNCARKGDTAALLLALADAHDRMEGALENIAGVCSGYGDEAGYAFRTARAALGANNG